MVWVEPESLVCSTVDWLPIKCREVAKQLDLMAFEATVEANFRNAIEIRCGCIQQFDIKAFEPSISDSSTFVSMVSSAASTFDSFTSDVFDFETPSLFLGFFFDGSSPVEEQFTFETLELINLVINYWQVIIFMILNNIPSSITRQSYNCMQKHLKSKGQNQNFLTKRTLTLSIDPYKKQAFNQKSASSSTANKF